MTLHLLIHCLCSLCLWTVNSQGVTENGNTRIQGPTFFVTDTTRDLTLSCQTNASAAVDFTWRHRGLNPCSVASANNCTFRPQMQDDGDNVTCIPQDSDANPLGRASYELHLKYPPPSSPTITMEPHQTEPLKQGDVITCTVTGGKPHVSSVTFYCQQPDHADLNDNVSNHTQSVSSSIIVNTSLATSDDMICTCYANWTTEPGLYSHKTNASFKLQRFTDRVKVATFTVNDTTELTVTEDSNTTVMFDCRATGIPKPTVRLYRQGSNSVLAQNSDSSVVQFSMGRAGCEDTGNYVCEADNGFPDPTNRYVRLVVNCGPRLDRHFVFNNMSPKELTSQGLIFGLVARPTPDVTVIRYLGRTTVLDNQTVPANMFQTQCRRDALSEHAVICEIKPVSVPTEYIGVYTMSLFNGLGTLTFRFEVKSPVSGPSPAEDNSSSPAVIGAVSGSVVVVVAVVIVAVVIWKYRHSQQQHRGQEHPPNAPPAAQQESYPSNLHVEIGNPYDVLQHGQEDDGRTYTELMASSTTEDGSYLHPFNS